MAKQNYSRFNSFAQKIGATRAASWFFSHTQHYFDRVILKATNGRTNLTSMLIGVPVVVVTSTGAKSGLQRTHPLLCIRGSHDADIFAIVGSNWGRKRYPAWYYNLKANPHATCAIQGQKGEYVAHEATGEAYEQYWQYAQNAYAGFGNYKQRVGERDIPIMIMTPDVSQPSSRDDAN